jgi:hypothetical protein
MTKTKETVIGEVVEFGEDTPDVARATIGTGAQFNNKGRGVMDATLLANADVTPWVKAVGPWIVWSIGSVTPGSASVGVFSIEMRAVGGSTVCAFHQHVGSGNKVGGYFPAIQGCEYRWNRVSLASGSNPVVSLFTQGG